MNPKTVTTGHVRTRVCLRGSEPATPTHLSNFALPVVVRLVAVTAGEETEELFLAAQGRFADGHGRPRPAARTLTRSASIACIVNVTIEQLQQLIAHDSAFTKSYGFVVTEASAGSCTLHVPDLPHFERPGGIVSGQVLMTAADVAMWLAIKTLRGIDDPSVTTQMQTNFLESARREAFTCKAVVVKLGRRTAFGTAECVSDSGKLLAHHTMTYAMPR